MGFQKLKSGLVLGHRLKLKILVSGLRWNDDRKGKYLGVILNSLKIEITYFFALYVNERSRFYVNLFKSLILPISALF